MSQDQEKYRDKIATVDEHGKRIWIYPKKPVGRFYNARTYVSWGLLIILFGLPFIRVNGQPLVLLNLLERNFILFGIHFSPQDFHLFGLAMLTLVVFIVLFTVVYGRLFCGWVCPQTIFMEMVFRKIEYWIEGDANAQRRLDNAPWTTDKVLKKTAKQAIFLGISILIAHTFLSYIIGVDQVWKIVTHSPANNWGGFFAMVAFTGAFYYVFARLREQVCTTICPYGRLQGVLTDKNTILVSYDWVRGEPRGKLQKQPKNLTGRSAASRGENLPLTRNPLHHIAATVSEGTIDETPMPVEEGPIKIKGDCIDCKLCIQVCPTGIDIRDGVQLECVHCTACIDACDEIMDKIGKPRGLIRYDSYTGIEAKKRKIFTGRVIAYTVVLTLLIGVNIWLLSNRGILETVVLRTPGMLYQKVDETHITNLYNFQVFNKTQEDLTVEFRLKDAEGAIRVVGDMPVIQASEMTAGAFFIELESRILDSDGQKRLVVEVWSNGKKIDEAKTNFLGPIQ